MREVFVVGAGMTQFGRHNDKSTADLGLEAMLASLKDAGLSIQDIQMIYCGHVHQGTTLGQRILGQIGYTGIPVINVENACASGSTAFRLAYQSVAGGFCDIAMAVGAEKMPRGIIDVGEKDNPDRAMGMLGLPVKYALLARKYMHDYGLSRELMARVAVKNHQNGCLNPNAQHKKVLTVEEILNSRMISDPLTLFQCCPTSDGAAAVIIVAQDLLSRFDASVALREDGESFAHKIRNLNHVNILYPEIFKTRLVLLNGS